jgi:hypothetical protein
MWLEEEVEEQEDKLRIVEKQLEVLSEGIGWQGPRTDEQEEGKARSEAPDD